MTALQESGSFLQPLDDIESAAIQAWLGIWACQMAEHQRLGNGIPHVASLTRAFSSALTKAPLFRGVVYRGLSARSSDPDREAYIRRLIEGPDVFELESDASASREREIGYAFTYPYETDPPRRISVLMVIEAASARGLGNFRHDAKDEHEVVLLRGTRYRRRKVHREADPREDQALWILEAEELACP